MPDAPERHLISISVNQSHFYPGETFSVADHEVAEWFNLTESFLAFLRENFKDAVVTGFSVAANGRSLTINAYPK